MKNFMLNPDRPLSFAERERQCEALFNSRGPFYHLCTPGDDTLTLFETDYDFCFAMNLIALVSYLTPDFNIITFEIMGSHLHYHPHRQFILSAEFHRLRQQERLSGTPGLYALFLPLGRKPVLFQS